MKSILLLFLFASLYFSRQMNCEAETTDVTVPEIPSIPEELVSSATEKQRIEFLKNLQFRIAAESNPDVEEMLQRLNTELNKRQTGFFVRVHVSKSYQQWWNIVKRIKLSQFQKSWGIDVRSEAKNTRLITGWSLVTALCDSGTTEPMFFKSFVILSPEVQMQSRGY